MSTALLAAFIGGALALDPAVANASASEVLILGSSVSGGTSSVEAQEVAAKGLTPLVVDDATWEGMSTAQFANYKAILIGDPTCGGTPPAAAVSTAATWGPAISGNTIIIGTDPVYHGKTQFVDQGVDFVLASDPGKVGGYLDLSCDYASQGTSTDAFMLDGLRGAGQFTVEEAPNCYNEAHIVATHPALTGLTDAYMSNWSCSVHEIFNTWPADFQVLAIAQDLGSSFTASDGTIGSPYILASGSGLKSFPLSVSPESGTAITGTTYSVTATLLDASTGLPAPGYLLSAYAADLAAPGAVTVATALACSTPLCETDSNGQVTFSYSKGTTGGQIITVWVDKNANAVVDPGEPVVRSAVNWVLAPPISGPHSDFRNAAAVRCLDAQKRTLAADGTIVQLWDCTDAANQGWQTVADGTIVNQASGRCLGYDPSASGGNGTSVTLWGCTGLSAQKWTLAGNGSIINQATGRCLDAATSSLTTNGTKVQLWDCNGGRNQDWYQGTRKSLPVAVQYSYCPTVKGIGGSDLSQYKVCEYVTDVHDGISVASRDVHTNCPNVVIHGYSDAFCKVSEMGSKWDGGKLSEYALVNVTFENTTIVPTANGEVQCFVTTESDPVLLETRVAPNGSRVTGESIVGIPAIGNRGC